MADVLDNVKEAAGGEDCGWTVDKLHFGCIGITAAMLGALPDRENCYKTRPEADARREEMKEDEECCPQIYSIHLWNDTGRDGENPDAQEGEDGVVDLSNWDIKPKPGGGGNYDYGFYDDAKGVYVSASHLHNPDNDGDGVGDFFRTAKNEDGTPKYGVKSSTVYFSTHDDWELEEPYEGFYNYEVFCVQCKGENLAPGQP